MSYKPNLKSNFSKSEAICRRAFKYRLQPSRSQRTKLIQTLELCRWVYNETLAARKNAWEQEKKALWWYDTRKLLTAWKKENPQLVQVFSQVLQNVQERVDLAFKAFFRRVKAGEEAGYPRFKGFGRYDSFTYCQFGFKILDKQLFLSKIGAVKIIFHRPIEGRIKTLTLQRDAVGNWYACFVCEVKPDHLPFNDLAIGIDVGLENFAKLSNAEKISNPRFFRRDEKALAKAQRKLSKEARGTPEQVKRRKAVAHIHQRIAYCRKDFAHQRSREVVNNFGMLAFERLDTQNMLKNRRLAKSISDAAWNQFITYTQYKAADADRVCILVDPRNTSKRCSRCGTLVEKDLFVRVHQCPVCDLVIDRDQNAAINILGLGLQSLGVTLEAPAFGHGE